MMTLNNNELNLALKTILKGTGIGLISSITILLEFGSKVLIARTITKAEYGIFSLAFAICGFITIIASLGLTAGTPRYIAYARGKNDYSKVRELISISILIALISGISFLLLIYASSDFLSFIFHDSRLSLPLKILSFTIPLSLVITALDSIFRGFDNVKPGIYFNKIFYRTFQFIFILVIFIFKLSFITIFYAILLSAGVTAFTFILYSLRKLDFSFSFSLSTALELLSFSIPLLGTSILFQMMAWTDTFMLGIFKSSTDVGLYNAANPLARFVLAPMLILNAIYIPVISRLYSKELHNEVRRAYYVITRWLCILTYPLFLLLFLKPESVLALTFGEKYVQASNALRILALGFMIGNILGPTYATLVALGESRFIMLASTFATALNVGLNIALIPPLGIVGAATATAISEIGVCLIRYLKVYSLSRSIPVSKNLIKPLTALTFIITVLVLLKAWFWILFPLSYLCLILVIFITKSLEPEDMQIIRELILKLK